MNTKTGEDTNSNFTAVVHIVKLLLNLVTQDLQKYNYSFLYHSVLVLEAEKIGQRIINNLG